MPTERDPVFYDEVKKLWYHWDETWGFRYGPFKTEGEARSNLERYKGGMEEFGEGRDW